MSVYSTKVTATKGGWLCAVLREGKIIVDSCARHREDIGPTLRDLLRTIDKSGGGDAFTASTRTRNNRQRILSVKHRWA
jgi:hypothetical protein